MTGTDLLDTVQFVTVKGKRLTVLSADDWEALVEWIEILEDVQIARQAYDELKAADGNREEAGWQKWDDNAAPGGCKRPGSRSAPGCRPNLPAR